MISDVNLCALKYMISENFFSQANFQVKTRQQHFANFNFQTLVTFFSCPSPVQVASCSLSQGLPWLPEHHLQVESRNDLSLPVSLKVLSLKVFFPKLGHHSLLLWRMRSMAKSSSTWNLLWPGLLVAYCDLVIGKDNSESYLYQVTWSCKYCAAMMMLLTAGRNAWWHTCFHLESSSLLLGSSMWKPGFILIQYA